MHGPLKVEQPSNITSEKVSDVPRYDPSIYSTPFSQLPNPKRVWLGSPSSSLEGLGTYLIIVQHSTRAVSRQKPQVHTMSIH